MNGLRVAVIVTILNLVILTLHLVEVRTAAQSVPQVLRGRALEIVDEHDRVRAEIRVFPAQPTLKMPDGSVTGQRLCWAERPAVGDIPSCGRGETIRSSRSWQMTDGNARSNHE